MPKATNHDFLLLFYCVVAGVFLCVLCDIFRAVRKSSKHESALTFILDFLFMITAALTTFFMQFIYSNGHLRWYIALGEIIGFISARICISPWLLRLLSKLFMMIKLLLKPIKAVVRACVVKIALIFSLLEKNIIKICKNVLKWARKMLYNVKDKSQNKQNAFHKKSGLKRGDKKYGTGKKCGKSRAEKA